MPKEKDMIKKISIYGGTHGNEWTGVYVVKHRNFSVENVEIIKAVSNPDAYMANKRYIDEDLNRCFSPSYIKSSNPQNMEHIKAIELAEQIKDVDLVLDLHTTTSDMGPTLIITKEDDLTLRICKQAQKYYPEIKIILEYGDPYLVSLSKRGIIIEVGPCPQGVVKGPIYEQTISCIEAILSSVKDLNAGHKIGLNNADLYEVVGRVDYPRNENNDISAYLHHFVEKSCFKYLKKGDPLFKTFRGEVILNEKYEGYPIFINEAAYYEKGTAFVLTKKCSH